MKTTGFSIPKIIKNNFYMMGIVCHADAGYIGFSLLARLTAGIRTSFLYVYLLGFVLYCVENRKEPVFILLCLLLSILFFAAAFALETYYEHIFEPVHRERIISRLQDKLFDKLQNADMANFDHADAYTTVALANEELAVRPLAVTDNFFRGFECLVTTCTAIIGAVSGSWLVFGICLVSFAAGIFLTNIQSKKAAGYDSQMKLYGKKISLLRRLLYLPEYAKDNRLSHVHDLFLADYKATVKDKEKAAADCGKKIADLSFLQKMFCHALCIDFFIPLYLSVAVLIFGNLSVPRLVIAVNASTQMKRRFDDLTDCLSEFLKNGRLAERIRDIEKIRCDIETADGTCPACRMQTLSANKVTFLYPDGTPGLSGVDFTIQKGSKVAVVGSNGSGKSTLIKLLLRFYDAASGEILQNGTDIRKFNIASYRSQFSTAFQDFNIYSTSIRNNVAMGDEIDEGRLHYALDKAGLAGEIKDTGTPLTKELDENGILFSGGLLQRLALARVFYKDSDIVIMDEPTAAMDVFFERKFYDTVFENLKEKTVIFVSHRLSSVTACDKILYMDQGKILEEGTHEELMGLQGGYYKLFHAQFE